MPAYSEDLLQRAITAVEAGTPVRRVVRDYSIPRTTLRGRLAGRQSKSTAHSHQQKLSPESEAQLVDWILTQGALGFPPTHSQIRLFVSRILQAGGSTEPLGKGWISGFLKRNPVIRTLRAKKLDSRRANRAIVEVISAWF